MLGTMLYEAALPHANPFDTHKKPQNKGMSRAKLDLGILPGESMCYSSGQLQSVPRPE